MNPARFAQRADADTDASTDADTDADTEAAPAKSEQRIPPPMAVH